MKRYRVEVRCYNALTQQNDRWTTLYAADNYSAASRWFTRESKTHGLAMRLFCATTSTILRSRA